MTTYTYGDGDNLSVTGFGANNTFTLGAGDFDTVNISGGSTNDTITLGNGDGDVVNGSSGRNSHDKITLGNGDGDTVTMVGQHNKITVGNGNNDTVYSSNFSTVKVGNGNDTIHVGTADTITVGYGNDTLIFDQTTPGTIGKVTINHFDPSKDVITIQNSLPTNVTYHDVNGNAVITVVDGSGHDTITLVGVHSSALHASDFHFV